MRRSEGIDSFIRCLCTGRTQEEIAMPQYATNSLMWQQTQIQPLIGSLPPPEMRAAPLYPGGYTCSAVDRATPTQEPLKEEAKEGCAERAYEGSSVHTLTRGGFL